MNFEKVGNQIAKIVFEGDAKKNKIIYVSADEENVDDTYTNIELTKPKERIVQMPVKERERDILYITGASGSGKSYYTRMYTDEYVKAYPKNPVFLISSISEDPSIDKVKHLKRIVLDDAFLTSELSAADFKDSLIIFDDTDCITNKVIRNKVNAILNSVLETGRHFKVSVIYTSHVANAGLDTKRILNESHSITIFPSSLGGRALKYLLDNYLGLDKKQISYIKNIKSRWVTILKTYPQVVLSEKEAAVIKNMTE